MMTAIRLCVATLPILIWGCAAPPTMKNVEQAATDTSMVFGSVEVYDEGELKKWGSRFFGHDFFYLTILPPDSNEAITHKLAKDGRFFWSLEPGEYLLLGYVWDSDTGQMSGHIGSTFRVPEAGTDTYIGSLVFRGNVAMLVPQLEDRFDEFTALHNERFPDRAATVVRELAESPERIGSYSAYRPPCDEAWNIGCSKRFRGVTPLSPQVAQSGFPMESNLMPEFRWKGCPRSEVSYDLILYEAAAYAVAGAGVPSYMRGRMIAYVEDLKEPRWRPTVALKPDTRYFWSVRLRDGDTVSGWSTQSHSTFLLVYMSWGYGQWFQFQTA
jgi:hypothetical protein